MAQIGKLEGFYCITCDVDTYFERLASYFKANRVAADARIDTFISVAGEKTYKLLKSLQAPEKPKDRSLDDIKETIAGAHAAQRVYHLQTGYVLQQETGSLRVYR